MKRECSIRFLLVVAAAAVAAGLLAGFFAGAKKSWDGYEERIALLQEQNGVLLARQALQKEEENLAESVKVIDPDGFVLLEEDGFVAVYRGDRKTRYMATDIPVDALPEDLQQEIRQGKQMEGEEQLYNFLENYSS